MPRSASSTASWASALRKIRSKRATVGVVGLGYVGLPHARLFVERGFRVIGLDTDPGKVRALRAGRSYIGSVPSSAVRRWRRFEPTTDYGRLAEADAVIICVPTPLTPRGAPDLSFVRGTAREIARILRPGQLVVLESTTYPGTTREVVKPILDRAGVPYYLAYSPEREDPGNRRFSTRAIPKLVGGADLGSLRLAAALYGTVVRRVVEVSRCEVAEAAKLLENVYRSVNIALVNELKICFRHLGIDIWEVIAAASTKPFGFQPFYPGPGMGGHCIPIDPFYLAWRARQAGCDTKFIRLAGEINTRMPAWVVERVRSALGGSLKGARILVLGLAYKKDIDDPRESPAWKIMDLLARGGARVSFNDPYIRALPRTRRWSHLRVPWIAVTPRSLRRQDALLLVTDHGAYDYPRIARHARLVVDTRHAFYGIDGQIVDA